MDGTLRLTLASDLTLERRRRLTRRALPALIALAAIALVAGTLVGGGESESERIAGDFATAWERGDYTDMHRLLSNEAQARPPPPAGSSPPTRSPTATSRASR